MCKLTTIQQKMIEDNHNLIYWFINKYKLSESEYYGLLAIELCEAVIHYDESKGSLANYFHLVCNGRIYMSIENHKHKKDTSY